MNSLLLLFVSILFSAIALADRCNVGTSDEGVCVPSSTCSGTSTSPSSCTALGTVNISGSPEGFVCCTGEDLPSCGPNRSNSCFTSCPEGTKVVKKKDQGGNFCPDRSLKCCRETGPPPFDCGSKCRFRLCSTEKSGVDPNGRRLQIRPRRVVPYSPLICLNDITDFVGYVTQIGPAQVQISDTEHIPLPDFCPTVDGVTLRPKFQRNFFKVGRVGPLRRSGIIRNGNYRGNQEALLDLTCIIIPIKKYERVNRRNRRVERVITTPGSSSDCVAFQASIMTILIDLTWDGGDGLDLILEEPTGDILSRVNPRTDKGFFEEDIIRDCTKSKKVGRETAVYRKRGDGKDGNFIPRGTYTYDVDIVRRCKRNRPLR